MFRHNGKFKSLALFMVLGLLLSACGTEAPIATAIPAPTNTTAAVAAPTDTTAPAPAAPTDTTAPPAPTDTTAPAAPTATEAAMTVGGVPQGFASWDDVVKQASGQTLNWYMWGGSDQINSFVDGTYGKTLKDKYNITLKRVPLKDTVEAVNKVLGEKQAGKNDGGSVDMIWINGENFKTARQADLLYGGWALTLPNAKYVPWDNPAVNLDFGFPVNGYESPWGSAQYQFLYDSAKMKGSDLPHSYAQLKTWVHAHPGRFTYVAPPAFYGTRFVKQALFELSGDNKQWIGDFNQDLYSKWSPQLFAYLKDLAPDLWRKGETYPKEISDLHTLFANGEVDISADMAPAGPGSLIKAGTVPPTTKNYVFDTGTIGDFHYLSIPYNSPHKAAALVMANLELEPDLQAAKLDPANWGDGMSIDPSKVDAASRGKIDEIYKNLGPGAVPGDVLAAHKLPDIVAKYQTQIESDWDAQIRKK